MFTILFNDFKVLQEIDDRRGKGGSIPIFDASRQPELLKLTLIEQI